MHLELLLRAQLWVADVANLGGGERLRGLEVGQVVVIVAEVLLADERVPDGQRADDGDDVRQAAVLDRKSVV